MVRVLSLSMELSNRAFGLKIVNLRKRRSSLALFKMITLPMQLIRFAQEVLIDLILVILWTILSISTLGSNSLISVSQLINLHFSGKHFLLQLIGIATHFYKCIKRKCLDGIDHHMLMKSQAFGDH